jgi:Luciferase-like monooxygenase
MQPVCASTRAEARAGGFKNDLVAVNDTTPHDQRYDRTVEYTLLIKRLLSSPGPISFAGRYYQVRNPRMAPPLPTGLFPGILRILISGFPGRPGSGQSDWRHRREISSAGASHLRRGLRRLLPS